MKYLISKIYLLSILAFLMGASIAQAQCTLVCNNFVHISLPQEGTLTFQSNGSEDIFLETTDCPISRLELFTYARPEDFQNNNPMSDMTFTVADDGMEFTYLIQDTLSGNACWGTFLIEDKLNTGCIALDENTIDWPTDMTTCDTDPSTTGEPTWPDDDDDLLVATSYADEVLEQTDSTSKIIRTWTVLDWCTNNTYVYVQIILTSCSTDNSNCILVCNDYVNISLPQEGTLTLTPTGMTDMFLEGNTCPDGTFLLSAYATPEDFQNNNPMSDMTFTVADDGMEFTYLIQDTLSGNACWGVFLIEDKTNPDCIAFDPAQITWPVDTLATCDISPTVTGEPEYTLIDNQIVAQTYDDVIIQTATSIFKVIRTWTVLDWCTNNTYTYTQIIFSPCVHPGDTNNDGVANHFDLLNIGLAYTQEGLARTDASINWTAQGSEDWMVAFNDGLNYKFADSDGDGLVDDADIVAINNNWGLTHDLATPSDDNNPPIGSAIDFYIEPDTLYPNTMVSLPIILGTPNAPAVDVYGLAFSVQYDTEKLVLSSSEINTANSWLGTKGSDLSVVYKFFPNEGRIDIALTKIDAIEVSGEGQLCALDIIIEDVIFLQQGSGGAEVSSDTYFTIEDIRLINNDAQNLTVNALSMPFILGENTTSIRPLTSTGNIKLFPNPATDRLVIESTTTVIERLEIFNVNGQIIQTISKVESLHIVPTLEWQEGFYLVKIYSDEGVYVEKVLVLR